MRYLFISIALLAVCSSRAQMKGSEIPGFLQRIPPLPATVDEAYNLVYPKTKKPPYQSYSDSLKAAINILAIEAGGKSYLLMAMADRLAEDNRKFDRVHIQLPVDKELENQIQELNNRFFRETEDFGRSIGNTYDSINKLNYPAMKRAALQLELYRKKLPGYVKKVQQILVETNAYMNKKGYNAVLDNHNINHQYYTQLLEVRGLMYDRIDKLLQQVVATWMYSADMVNICKKHPESCE